jgi:hypothetical protein
MPSIHLATASCRHPTRALLVPMQIRSRDVMVDPGNLWSETRPRTCIARLSRPRAERPIAPRLHWHSEDTIRTLLGHPARDSRP